MSILNKKTYSFTLLILLVVGLASCNDDSKMEGTSTLTISAAASLTDALQDVTDVFNEHHPDIQVDFNFGGSGALQQQITQGAPVDIFFSASKKDFHALIDSGHIDLKNSAALLKNELVLVTPISDETVTSLNNITEAEQIAVGTPESVPAGEYARQTFESLGITEEVSPLLVFAEDVRSVLTYVERGEVNAGLVYRTDAAMSDTVNIIEAAPAAAHEPIIYPVGLINNTDNVEAARIFYEFLQTEDALALFDNYGFITE